jgi:acetylornithine deacetylase/succinyl-diaminopimelate desuccinylase-like protein
MQIDHVVKYIDAEAIARDTLDFIRIPSETGDEGPACAFLADLMRRERLEPILDEAAPGRHNLYVHCPGAAPAEHRSLLFNGHIDTVPIGVSTPAGRDGDWIVGRGAEDMKGGLVAMVHAVSALRKADVQLQGDLWLTAIVGHEEGKEGTLRLVERLEQRCMRPDAIVIGEGSGAIWLASLGATIFHITLTSPLGAIHTSRVPYARNPARWLGEMLVAFQRKEEQFEKDVYHPLCGRELINIGVAEGGDYYNRLPTPIKVSGQWRWKPGKTFADVDAELRALCADICSRGNLAYDLVHDGAREPFETSVDDRIVAAVSAAAERITGETPRRVGRAVTGDANFYARVPLWRGEGTIPTIYYGPDNEPTTAHSDDERVSLDALVRCAKVYAATAIMYAV